MDAEIESIVREAVAAAMRDIQQSGVDIAVVDDMVVNGVETDFEGEGIDLGGSENPESFRCIYDANKKAYKIINPVVCTPYGQVVATGADNLSAGEYYCNVKMSGYKTFFAEIVDSSTPDESTVVIVPIANITEDGEIVQKHVGTIVIGDTERYIAGDYTNVVFTPQLDGYDKGKIKVDVFYT